MSLPGAHHSPRERTRLLPACHRLPSGLQRAEQAQRMGPLLHGPGVGLLPARMCWWPCARRKRPGPATRWADHRWPACGQLLSAAPTPRPLRHLPWRDSRVRAPRLARGKRAGPACAPAPAGALSLPLALTLARAVHALPAPTCTLRPSRPCSEGRSTAARPGRLAAAAGTQPPAGAARSSDCAPRGATPGRCREAGSTGLQTGRACRRPEASMGGGAPPRRRAAARCGAPRRGACAAPAALPCAPLEAW